MKKTSLFFLSALSLLTFQNCGSDTIELPENDLEGKMEGTDWTYGTANGFRLSTSGQYEVNFISDEELTSSPCSLPSPGRSHVKAIFRPGFQSFTVSPVAINDDQIQVVFQVTNAKAITANSGFMEVFDISGGIISGYLQASEDVNSTFVEGRVEIELCN